MNEILKGVFDRASLKYDTFGPMYFSYCGKRLVELTGITEGKKVLDVAAGRGASMFSARDKVGTSGSVIGIDFSSGMVDETNKDIEKKGLVNVKMIQMCAEELDFDDNTFDYVLCGLSIQFFSDYQKALNEIYRVLKNGGIFGLITWKKKEGAGVLGEVLPKYIPVNTNMNNAPGRPDFGTELALEEMMKKLNFKSIDTIVENKRLYYLDEEDWWNDQWANSSRGAFERIEKLGEDTMLRFKEDAIKELQKFRDEKGIFFDANVIYTICKK
ncbi:MAG: class I SAM-dependent methyltransferase [Ruminiclostridium sp.]|nr:class I SAM-dependent methyltransferase [Ruminiclostridium sp.]